ncbi:hypothetical protein B0T10DRAFT_235647 [Thelonectria olida]|uniref:Uncharacterized protein n=1 Tax=Thelonectria olida TaxID=1576542 RepID=A0A9P8VQA3_9HYPO|nr:hypothetical protein B0T10DRAFT_235647 [Thelonectria olida]
MPLSEAFASEVVSRSEASGAISLFESGSHTPIIPSVTSTGNGSSQGIPGDPLKRARPAPDEPAGDVDQFAHGVAPLIVDGSSASGSLRHGSSPPDQMGLGKCEGYILDETDEHGRKKRRRGSESKNNAWVYDRESQPKDRFQDPYWDGCITPGNSQAFLADVNWELGKIGELG